MNFRLSMNLGLVKTKIAKFFLGLYALPMNLVLRNTSSRRGAKLIGYYVNKLYSKDEYCLVSAFPKRIAPNQVKGSTRNFSDVAIILQGPVAVKDDFTLNSIRMYREYYDGIHIIVSTWIDTPAELTESLKSAGADVVLNEYPEANYIQNLNYQLTTSLAGVRRAKEIGVRYAVKTRTDQRYYNPNALSMLLGMYEEGKVIALGGTHNTGYAKPFHISDYMAFGSVEELLIFYSCEMDTKSAVEQRVKDFGTQDHKRFTELVEQAEVDTRIQIPREFDDAVVKYASPETLISYHYFCCKDDISRYAGAKEAYDTFLRNHIILVDADSLGFFFLKYHWQSYNPTWFHRPRKLDMAKWYDLKLEGK